MKKDAKNVFLAAQANVRFQRFKEWVEGTNLFSTIVSDSRRYASNDKSDPFGALSEYFYIHFDGNALSLRKGVVINRVEELPNEILVEFFNNWPENNIDNERDQDNSFQEITP